MNIHWFCNEDNLIYINGEKDLHRLEVQLRRRPPPSFTCTPRPRG